MFNANQFVDTFNSMDMLQFAINFHKLGRLDVQIIAYLCKCPVANYQGVPNTRVFRGNYSELTKILDYNDQSNMRKACLRLENIEILFVRKDGCSIKEIVLNKYWMLKVIQISEN